jgi:autotransporter-associated beta strand protein
VDRQASGGGGAGQIGGSPSNATTPKLAGNGGAGIFSSITGTSVQRGGGGGGGVDDNNSYSSGAGGAGGGGKGGGQYQNNPNTGPGSAGTANTGGGGGGGTRAAGGSGGSGIVVVRYAGAALENVSGDNIWSGAITLGSTIGISSLAGTLTLSGAIGESGSGFGITKIGASTVALSGTNTYTGATSILQGTLQIGAGGTTGSLSPSSGISVASGATFAVNRSDTVTQGTQFSGAAITGAGNFAQNGAGKTTLNVANSYTGTTTVSGGKLEVKGSLSGTTAVTVSAGGNLLLNSSSGASNTVGGGTAVPNTAANNGGALVGPVTVASATAGGATYNGTSTGAASTLTVGNGTAGSSGNGTTHSFGAMTLSGANVIDFSNGTTGNTNVNLFINTLTSTTGFTLQVKGYNNGFGLDYRNSLGNASATDSGNFGDNTNRLIFGSSVFGVGNYIPNISFDGFGVGATEVAFGTGYEIVPVPEPATIALIGTIALCALFGYRERRRFTGFGKRTAARK